MIKKYLYVLLVFTLLSYCAIYINLTSNPKRIGASVLIGLMYVGHILIALYNIGKDTIEDEDKQHKKD